MKRKYNTRCWLCDSTDLEPDEKGIHCRSCDATYNIIPKPGSAPITLQRDLGLVPKGKGSFQSASPSGITIRKATKTRLTQQTAKAT